MFAGQRRSEGVCSSQQQVKSILSHLLLARYSSRNKVDKESAASIYGIVANQNCFRARRQLRCHDLWRSIVDTLFLFDFFLL
jgi:hypothetical protein